MFRLLSVVAIGISLMCLGGCAMMKRPGPVASTAPGEPLRSQFLINVDKSGLALQGHDPVAFFTDKKPVMGSPRFQTVYKGATYQFASAEHKSMFDRDPAMYEPQFGGFCGYAASINRVSPISVEFFEILDGRLVLQHNQKAWNLWHKDVPANLKRADANWPGLVDKHGV